MPSPVPRDVHVDQALTNISIAYKQSADGFIAEKVFPVVPVSKQSDKYFVYEKGAFFRDSARKRAPATESAGGGLKLGTDTYFCEKWAHHTDVDLDTEANQDEILDMQSDAAELNMQTILIRRERLFVEAFFGTGVWGTEVAGTTNFAKWDDQATSDPLADISTARSAILIKTGRLPNKLVVGYYVHEALKMHPLIVEHYKYTGSDSITTQMLARYFEVDDYVVSYAVYSDDAETTAAVTSAANAAASLALIAGNHALLCYAAPRPSKMMPSAGYNFTWKGLTGLNDMGIRTNRFYLDTLQANRVEVELSCDMKLVAADMGYFFLNAV